MNQPAYELVRDRYSAHCIFEETVITLKHEGKTLAYAVKLKGEEFAPTLPDWTSDASAPPTPPEKA